MVTSSTNIFTQLKGEDLLGDLLKEVNALIKNVSHVIISSIDGEGYPNTKAMLPPRMLDGIKHIYFSTNTSSIRVQQYMRNPKACIYFYDDKQFKGVMLKGIMEVLHDTELKKLIWRDGDEKYYSKGINDADYCVLKFTADNGRYYYNFISKDFIIE